MPKFSFISIAYNAEKHLPDLLSDLRLQTFPHQEIEVLLVNSASTDKTEAIMQDFAKDSDFYSCRVLQNDKRFLAYGWNVALSHASGDIIVKIDAHARIKPDFLTNVADNIDQGEDIVGGQRPTIFEDDSIYKRVLNHAESSIFGSGVATYRRQTARSYVKTLAHAAYRKEVFDKVGKFNTLLVRTEDNEMHYRMRKAGYKFCMCPDIISYQYVRNSLKSMLKQKWGNGFWVGITLFVCPNCFSLYNFIPLAFVITIFLLAIASMLIKCALPIAALFAIYLFAAISATVKEQISEKDIKTRAALIITPIIFLLMHIAYGVGTFWGIIRAKSIIKKHRKAEQNEV